MIFDIGVCNRTNSQNSGWVFFIGQNENETLNLVKTRIVKFLHLFCNDYWYYPNFNCCTYRMQYKILFPFFCLFRLQPAKLFLPFNYRSVNRAWNRKRNKNGWFAEIQDAVGNLSYAAYENDLLL